MLNNLVPTKGNLINVKKSLKLARMGFDLMDRKRNILIREMMMSVDKAKALRGRIDSTFSSAYFALQRANITLGSIAEISASVPVEHALSLTYYSVMGVELPIVKLDCPEEPDFCYGFSDTNTQLDKAYLSFHYVKQMTAELAELENCIYRLANAIKKTQSRANALKNIIIPSLEYASKFITDALEEKEREEFTRLKVIKEKQQREAEIEQAYELEQQREADAAATLSETDLMSEIENMIKDIVVDDD